MGALNPITGRIPTDWVEYTPTGVWENLFDTGVMPPGSTGVLLQSTGLVWRLNSVPPVAVQRGFSLQQDETLELDSGADLMSFCFLGTETLRMQFFTGPTGSLPKLLSAGNGGGGGGAVNSVGAALPLQVAGTTDPVVSISAGLNGNILQFDGLAWVKRTGLTGRTSWVDADNGDDNTAERYNPHRPYATLNNAQEDAQEGDLIHVRPGIYGTNGDIINKSGLTWWFDFGTFVTARICDDNFLDGTHIDILGYAIFDSTTYCIQIAYNSHITIQAREMVCHSSGPQAISVTGQSAYLLVEADISSDHGIIITQTKTSVVTLNGKLTATGSAIPYACVINDGTFTINGDLVNNITGLTTAIFINTGTVIVNGSITGPMNRPIECVGDAIAKRIEINGLVQGVSSSSIRSKDLLVLHAGTRLYNAGDQPCVVGPAGAVVKAYGAYANRPLGPDITLYGDLAIGSWVID